MSFDTDMSNMRHSVEQEFGLCLPLWRFNASKYALQQGIAMATQPSSKATLGLVLTKPSDIKEGSIL
jgi:hypothetical protein